MITSHLKYLGMSTMFVMFLLQVEKQVTYVLFFTK